MPRQIPTIERDGLTAADYIAHIADPTALHELPGRRPAVRPERAPAPRPGRLAALTERIALRLAAQARPATFTPQILRWA